MIAAAPGRARPMARPPAAAANSATLKELATNPFKGVDWSIAFVSFCFYIIAITTYRLPVGTETMVIALVTLPMEKRGMRFPPVVALACVLVAWSFLGWTTTEFPDVVLDTITEFAKVCAVTLVAVNVLTTRARLRFFLMVFLISYLIYPVRGSLIGWYTGDNTLQGRAIWNVTYSNPNDLAGLCLLQLSMALGMVETERKLWVRAIGWSAVMLLPVIIILTQSRGAFIALVAIMLIGGRRILRSPKKLALLAVLVVTVALIAPAKTWDRFASVQDVVDVEAIQNSGDEAESSTVQRLEIWKVARTIISENLIMGVGLGGYSSAHFIYAQRPNFLATAMGRRDTHSTYFNLLAETGVVGFGLFIAIVLTTVRNARRIRKQVGSFGAPLAVQLFYLELGIYGFLVAGIWGSYAKLIPTYIHLGLIYVAAQLLLEDYEKSKKGGARAPVQPGKRRAPSFFGARA